MADRSDRDRHDIADVDGETVDLARLLQTFRRMKEGRLDVPAIRARTADRAALDADRIELHPGLERSAKDVLELKSVGRRIVDGALLRSHPEIADLVVHTF